jgi:hypothetical protein
MKKNWIQNSVWFLILVFASGITLRAHAATLNYGSPANISLSSPATILTIATGSVADNLVVNATSVVVTLSSSTGGTFTISSPAYDLTVASSSLGGTAMISCLSGSDSTLLSQSTGSTVYTITPSGTTCAGSSSSTPIIVSFNAVPFSINSGAATTLFWATNLATSLAIDQGVGAVSPMSTGSTTVSPSGTTTYTLTATNSNGTSTAQATVTVVSSSGGGSVGVAYGYASGGGGGGGPITPYVPLITTTTTTSLTTSTSISSLQAELNTLLAELASLEAQANGGNTSASSPSFFYTFTRNLSYGITGSDVKELQMFLISQNAGSAAQKLAAHGTTKTFATLTLNALIEFQKKAGIKPAVGYFGPITRAYVNTFMK